MLDRLSERNFLGQEDGGSNKPKQQRQQRERQRSKFGLAKQPFCANTTLFCMHDNDVEISNFTFLWRM